MRIFDLKSMFGAALGAAVGIAAVSVHAHSNGAAHGGPGDRELLSISGSPAQLAARSERLAAHVCEVIAVAADCPVLTVAVKAAADLQALQGRYEEGQRALHLALLSPAADADEWQSAQAAQLALLEHSSRRYLRFLGEAAASLSGEQKQRFAR